MRHFCASGVSVLRLKGTLWNKIISGQLGEQERGWCSTEVREGFSLGLWGTIKSGGLCLVKEGSMWLESLLTKP